MNGARVNLNGSAAQWRRGGRCQRFVRELGVRVNAAAMSGSHASRTNPGGSGVSAAGPNPGERAAELIGELRSMLEPLLAATGGQQALAQQLAALAGEAWSGRADEPPRRRRCHGGRGSPRS